MSVCLYLGSLFEILEDTEGPEAIVTERLGKKRIHSGKLELTIRCGDDTSTNLIACLCF